MSRGGIILVRYKLQSPEPTRSHPSGFFFLGVGYRLLFVSAWATGVDPLVDCFATPEIPVAKPDWPREATFVAKFVKMPQANVEETGEIIHAHEC